MFNTGREIDIKRATSSTPTPNSWAGLEPTAQLPLHTKQLQRGQNLRKRFHSKFKTGGGIKLIGVRQQLARQQLASHVSNGKDPRLGSSRLGRRRRRQLVCHGRCRRGGGRTNNMSNMTRADQEEGQQALLLIAPLVAWQVKKRALEAGALWRAVSARGGGNRWVHLPHSHLEAQRRYGARRIKWSQQNFPTATGVISRSGGEI